MALIQIQPIKNLTKEQLQNKLGVSIRGLLTREFAQLGSTFSQIAQLIWKNPNLSVQEAFDSLGEDAQAIMMLASKVQEVMNLAVPNSNTFSAPNVLTPDEKKPGHLIVGDPVK